MGSKQANEYMNKIIHLVVNAGKEIRRGEETGWKGVMEITLR